jgi:hypothetical protein
MGIDERGPALEMSDGRGCHRPRTGIGMKRPAEPIMRISSQAS